MTDAVLVIEVSLETTTRFWRVARAGRHAKVFVPARAMLHIATS
jgi:hypothetical protein